MANKLIDLTGVRFGNLVVKERSKENDRRGKPQWVCICDCGNVTTVRGDVLKRGDTKTCGCSLKNTRGPDKTPRKITTQRASKVNPLYLKSHKNPLYHRWSDMKLRCKGICTQKQYYSGKGISYCQEWEDFDVFADWAIKNGYQPGLEIDRIDSDMNYTPDNCRWVSHKKNSRNRKARSNNTTGYPGVQERKLKSGGVSYRVVIRTDNGRINLGSYATIEEAIAVRREAEIKYWGFNIGE